MMERLARLADRRARRVLIFTAIFFVVAGALGTGVAERLDPFGADHAKSESVIADQRLEQAGFRETGVVVLVEGANARSPRGRKRIETITGELTANPEVASVSSFLNTGSSDFLARGGGETYLAVTLKPPMTMAAKPPPSGSPTRSPASPGLASAGRRSQNAR